MRAVLCATLCAALSFLAVGCDHPTPTQVLVILDADEALRAEGTHLQIDVVNQEGVLRTWAIDLAAPGAEGVHFPVTLPLVPRGGDPSRTFDVEATLTDADDVVIGLQRLHTSYVLGELRVARIHFSDDCRSQACTAGNTCRNAVCVDSCVLPTAPADRSIVRCAVDDAGPLDAGPLDVGPSDAFEPDASRPVSDCDERHADAIFCEGWEGELPGQWEFVTDDAGLFVLQSRQAWRGGAAAEARTSETDPTMTFGVNTGVQLPPTTVSTEMFLRISVFVPEDSPPTDELNLTFAGGGDSTGLAIGLDDDLRPIAYNAQTEARVVARDPIMQERWACLEAHVVLGTAGSIELWVDDVSQGRTEVDTSSTYPVTGLFAGITLTHGQPPFGLFVDELVLDDEPIGCD